MKFTIQDLERIITESEDPGCREIVQWPGAMPTGSREVVPIPCVDALWVLRSRATILEHLGRDATELRHAAEALEAIAPSTPIATLAYPMGDHATVAVFNLQTCQFLVCYRLFRTARLPEQGPGDPT